MSNEMREAFQREYEADPADPAMATELRHFSAGWQACAAAERKAAVEKAIEETRREQIALGMSDDEYNAHLSTEMETACALTLAKVSA
jgi:hypothetical protein